MSQQEVIPVLNTAQVSAESAGATAVPAPGPRAALPRHLSPVSAAPAVPIDPATASHALVESPLQLLSSLEARFPDESLVIHARLDATGMPVFLEQFPGRLLPASVVIVTDRQPTDSLPHTSGRILVGDVLSGQFQRQLAGAVRTGQLGLGKRRHAGPAGLVLLDDGLATVAAVRTMSRRHAHPLIRSSLEAGTGRTALGQATAHIVRRLMRVDRLTWVTAMKVDKSLARSFTLGGGRLHRHKFEWARGLDWTGSAIAAGQADAGIQEGARAVAPAVVGLKTAAEAAAPAAACLPEQVILGTAFAADGLIDPDKYVGWVAEHVTAHDGHSTYYPHRRQTQEILEHLSRLPNLTVVKPGLPVELRLAQAPKHTIVRSLPSTAVTTLPLVMRHPHVTVDPIPEDWWTAAQPDSKRRALNELTDDALPRKKPRQSRVRILAVADSESYLKWAILLLTRLQEAHPEIDTDVVVMDSPIRPTGPQIAHAVAGTRWQDLSVRVVKRSQLRRFLTWARPTVVLAAATGPVVSQVYATAMTLKHRPGLVSGLPGMGLPATRKGQRYRKPGDLFITHSPTEAAAYTQAIDAVGGRARTVVTRLPMLTGPAPASAREVDTVVFAPQAKVPVGRDERIAILLALAAWKRAGRSAVDPTRTVDDNAEAVAEFAGPSRHAVLKVRSMPGEHETHNEQISFLALRDELIADGQLIADDIEVHAGPMSTFLAPGAALVTVSSTAVLEALDRGLPAIVLTDFGLTDQMLNAAFAGSGLEGTLHDLRDGRFKHARPEWLRMNYFQEPTDDLFEELEELSRAASADELERDVLAPFKLSSRRLRAEIRSAVPKAVVSAYRRGRRR